MFGLLGQKGSPEQPAAVELAEVTLSFTKLVAPIDGRLGAFVTPVGNVVKADETTIVHVVASDPVTVTFDVDDRPAVAIRRALNDGGKPTVEVGLNDEDGYPHKAALNPRVDLVDAKTDTVRFRATLANPKGLFVHGRFVRVRLTVQPGK